MHWLTISDVYVRMETEVANADKVKVRNRYGDPWIWGIYCTLCLVSVVAASRTSIQQVGTAGIYGPIGKHIVTMLIGMAALFVTQFVSFKRRSFTWSIIVFALLTLVALVYVMKHGQVINGAMRSMSLFGFSVQPAELAKLATVLLVAFIMSRYQEPGGVRNIGVVLSAFVVLLFGSLTYKQGFTNTAILMCISLSMMLIGGVQVKKFLVVLLVYGIAGVGYMAWQDKGGDEPAVANNGREVVDRSSTREKRLDRFDWSEDACLEHPLTDKYKQEQYAYMARAHGGIFGVFPGNSRESSRLPLAFSDYIYSIIIEEMGLVGGLLVLVLYLALLARAGRIAQRCTRAFPALLVLGMAVMITVQALSHIAINCGMVPVSGQPLPLISAGGSSMVAINIAFGVMIGVSKNAAQRGDNGRVVLAGSGGDDRSRVLQAENPTQIK